MYTHNDFRSSAFMGMGTAANNVKGACMLRENSVKKKRLYLGINPNLRTPPPLHLGPIVKKFDVALEIVGFFTF